MVALNRPKLKLLEGGELEAMGSHGDSRGLIDEKKRLTRERTSLFII